MKIKPFISAKRVVLHLAGDDQRQILDALIQPLTDDDVIRDPEQFISDLIAREKQVTTMMGNGIALPHARSYAVRRVGLAVGIAAEEGLIFDPESDCRCRLFFCIAVPAFTPTAHMPLLKALAGFARDEERVERLVNVRTRGEAAKLLSAFRS